jgi:hypothetical protein
MHFQSLMFWDLGLFGVEIEHELRQNVSFLPITLSRICVKKKVYSYTKYVIEMFHVYQYY